MCQAIGQGKMPSQWGVGVSLCLVLLRLGSLDFPPISLRSTSSSFQANVFKLAMTSLVTSSVFVRRYDVHAVFTEWRDLTVQRRLRRMAGLSPSDDGGGSGDYDGDEQGGGRSHSESSSRQASGRPYRQCNNDGEEEEEEGGRSNSGRSAASATAPMMAYGRRSGSFGRRSALPASPSQALLPVPELDLSSSELPSPSRQGGDGAEEEGNLPGVEATVLAFPSPTAAASVPAEWPALGGRPGEDSGGPDPRSTPTAAAVAGHQATTPEMQQVSSQAAGEAAIVAAGGQAAMVLPWTPRGDSPMSACLADLQEHRMLMAQAPSSR